MHIFLLIPMSFLFRGNVVSAECRRNINISRAQNQPLTRVWDRKLHRIGFPVMIRHSGGRATQKLDYRIVTQMKFVCLTQVHDTGQRDDAGDASLVGGKTQCQLTTGGVTHDHKLRGVEVMFLGILHQKLIRGTNVGECAGPRPTIVANSSVFNIRGSHALRRQSRAEMASVVEIVFRSPVAAVDIHHKGRQFAFAGGEA